MPRQSTTISPLDASGPAGLATRVGALPGSGASGILVRGAWGAGVSRLLSEAVRHLRGTGRRVAHRVGTISGIAELDLAVIDDVHHLSDRDASHLRDALLDDRATVVLGCRADAQLPAAIAWLVASGALAEVTVEALDESGVQHLVESTLRGPAHPALLRRLLADSAGQRSFVDDLVAEAISCGAVGYRNGLWRLVDEITPSGALLRRVAAEVSTLPAEAVRGVELLAVAERLPLAAARQVLADGLDPLVHRGLANLDEQHRVHLFPPATGLAVRTALGPVALAERAARLLEQAGAAGTPSQLARWNLLTGVQIDGEPALAAARAAFAGGDAPTALSLVTRAATADAAVFEATVLQELGRRADAAHRLRSVVADESARPGTRGTAAAELAQLLLWDLGQPDEAATIMDGLASAVAGTRYEPAVLPARVATALYAGDPRSAIHLGQPALQDATAASAQLSSMLGVAHALTGECRHGIELCEAGHAGSRGDRSAVDDATDAAVSLVLALEQGGELEQAEGVARDRYASVAGGKRASQAWMALCRLRVALVRGQLADAGRLGLEASVGFADLDQHATLRWALAGRLLAASQRGEVEPARVLLHELDELGPSGVQFLDSDVKRSRAWGLAVLGERSAAQTEMARAAQLAATAGSASLAAHAWHDLLRIGGVDEGARQLLALRGVDSRWTRPRTDHARSRRAADVAGLLRAAAGFEAIGAALHAAEATAEALRAAEAQGRRREVREVRALLPSRLERCPGARTPALAPAVLPVLTPRELEVAERARGGATSRAIAADLGVSVRTVDNLLQRAYAKLGISSRRELASRFDGGGTLVRPPRLG